MGLFGRVRDLLATFFCPPPVRRSHQYMVELFERSELQLMHTALQKNFPKGLFKVRMYALKPRPT